MFEFSLAYFALAQRCCFVSSVAVRLVVLWHPFALLLSPESGMASLAVSCEANQIVLARNYFRKVRKSELLLGR